MFTQCDSPPRGQSCDGLQGNSYIRKEDKGILGVTEVVSISVSQGTNFVTLIFPGGQGKRMHENLPEKTWRGVTKTSWIQRKGLGEVNEVHWSSSQTQRIPD